MNTEDMIREVRRLEEKHKNDQVFTGGTKWSDMCHDVANRLEELYNEVQELKSKNETILEKLEKTLSDVNFEKSTKKVNVSFYDGISYAYDDVINLIKYHNTKLIK